MQAEHTNNLIIYQEKYQPYVQQFSKRVTIAEFKQLDSKRISNQFAVLQSSYTPNEETVYHYGEKGKDRYSDIHTYKHNRIEIPHMPNFYINASLMRSVIDREVFAVFAQAPVKKVIDHFWYACYHYDIRKIIMLCAFQDPNRGTQAEKYWPPLGEQVELKSVNITIRCQSEEQINSDGMRTKVILRGPEGEKIVQHDHWTGWGDMKKPIGESSQQFFQNLVKESIELIQQKHLILIHCSAGIGRTGTLGAVIEALRCARKNKQLSVFEIVDNMRRGRMACVQTLEQYNFIYHQLQKML